MQQKISNYLKQYKKLAVALSGSANSALLLREAVSAIGPENVLAITVSTELLPENQCSVAVRMAQLAGVTHAMLSVDLLEEPSIRENGPKRCFYCKRLLFQAMLKEAWLRGFDVLAQAEETQVDDPLDDEIAMLLEDLGVISPFSACGMDRAAIQALGYEQIADIPKCTCLADRVPSGISLTEALLEDLKREYSV